MANKSKQITTGLIILACVAIVIGVKHLDQHKNVQSVQGRTKGNPEAPIKIVEFIDFQCPACAAGAKYLNEYIKNNPDAIHLEMKYFPLKGHVHGLLSARFVECASQQGKFWDYHDILVEKQKDWKKLINAYPSFELMAQQVNLDMEKMNVCLQDNKVDTIIDEHKQEGIQLKVRSTPTYFVNGNIVVGLKNLKAEIAKLHGAPAAQ